MKVIFLSFFLFVSFLQAQTVVENFTQKTPLVVLPDILIKKDTILITNYNQGTFTTIGSHSPAYLFKDMKGYREYLRKYKSFFYIVEEELKGKKTQVAVLSGPSHAEEVGKGIPTTCVVSAHNKELTLYLQNIFMNPSFRVYTSPDMLGIEIGGALKNVIALAAGIADGLNYGDNTKAALITRGIKEIASLGVAMGGEQSTFYGLTGLGDLIVTCASMHSRNRRAGILLGQGKTLDEAIKEVNMVVEGVYSAKSALMAAKKYNIEIPIIEQVNAVLFENKNAAEAVNELMIRDKKLEIQSW